MGQLGLALCEEVSPEGSLRRGFHLGQIEIDALPGCRLSAPGVEQRQRSPKDGGRNGDAFQCDVRLIKVKSALPVHEEGQRAVLHGIVAIPRFIVVRESAFNGVEPVEGCLDGVYQPVPCRVLIVVQVALSAGAIGAGVEGVDEHAGDGNGARDLDARLPKLLGYRWHLPVLSRSVARWRAAWRLVLSHRTMRSLLSPHSERCNTSAKGIVHVGEVLAECLSEQLHCALNGLKCDITYRGHQYILSGSC